MINFGDWEDLLVSRFTKIFILGFHAGLKMLTVKREETFTKK